MAAIIAGFVAAADIARQNGDSASAARWESTADAWRSSLADRTYTTDGFWGGHRYYERIDQTQDPNGPHTIHFNGGDSSPTTSRTLAFSISPGLASSGPMTPTWRPRLRRPPLHPTATPRCRSRCLMAISTSTGTITTTMARAIAIAPGGSSQWTQPLRTVLAGPFRGTRGVRDRERPLGECLPEVDGRRRKRRLFRAGAGWDRADIACFAAGRPTGSAAPLDWAEGQYLRLAQSIDAGYDLDTPSVVKAKYRGAGPILGAAGKCIDDAGASTDNGSAIQLFTCNGTGAQSWTWNGGDGTLRVLNKCMDVTGGASASGTPVQLWDCNGTAAQEWRWRQQSRLVNPQSGRCLIVAGSGSADGTRLQISDCGDTAGQVWRLP